jgi:hypothetical protein
MNTTIAKTGMLSSAAIMRSSIGPGAMNMNMNIGAPCSYGRVADGKVRDGRKLLLSGLDESLIG